MNPALPSDDPSPSRRPAEVDPAETAPMGTVPSLGPQEGDSVGRYRLLQKLGEGGCGIVYLAEQAEPVRRRVALKIIKLGMDTKAVIARFEVERQALALMEHPSIARVFDAGSTQTGRPYFVMELVRGLRITDYCDQHNASTRERLELFTQVCHAVQHAHQKGIIHRDLKPSNILVAVQDGVPVPKVIDFGIAKTMHGRLTDATVFTAFDQFIGTPAYMSPEQAEMSGLDIDTRSDIYSLGVVLYELLTGRLPFNPQTLADSGRDEIRRVIRDVDPPRPSLRLQALDEADRTTVARQRGALATELSAQLRGDLDWMVMKALEKQRNRRYASAAEFAADVARYLQDEPVAARPPSTVYRARKFVARHKVGVAAAAAVVFALLGGAVVSTWQAVRARDAERLAQAERTNALAARTKAVEARTRAESLLDFMLGDLRTEVKKVGKLDLLESVGEQAMAYFASLDPRDLSDTTLLQQARTLRQIGEIRMDKGKYAEAQQAFSGALARVTQLVARHPQDTGALFERSQVEFYFGALARKEGAQGKAKEWLTRYRDTAGELVRLEPAKLKWHEEVASGAHNLAVLKRDEGNLEEARADFEAKLAALKRMVALNPGDRELRYKVTDTDSWLGSLAEQMGDYRSALEHFGAESRGLKELQNEEPANKRWEFERADSLSFLARVYSITGRVGAAKDYAGQARLVFDRLIAHDPENLQWAISSHRLRLREAAVAWAEGATDEALALVATAEQGFQAILAKLPRDPYARRELVAVLRQAIEMQLAAHKPVAGAAVQRALDLGEEVFLSMPRNPEVVMQHARLLVTAAEFQLSQGDPKVAGALAGRAEQLLRARLERSKDWRCLEPASRALALLGRNDESAQLWARLSGLGYQPFIPRSAPTRP